ncbi:bolA-like protein 3 [Salmo trutta]|uniref:BolA-like protein 3 n=1 Tax=Salmo trutta TaxID=8032 RepID=A0A674F215_SALTR|nr:bolA-like protein 3 [Salmo trutta]
MLSILKYLLKNQAVLVSRQLQRTLSSQTDGETRIAHILKEKFPSATSLKVVDISGGCGAMYEVHIESNAFKGKRTVQQHQLVNQALKEEIQGMHGLRIFTDVPRE